MLSLLILAPVLAVSPPPSTAAGMITALATVITAIGGLIIAVGVLIPTLKQVRKVHVIVNQQRTNMENFQRALLAQLREAGITPVVDQSLPPAPDTPDTPPS